MTDWDAHDARTSGLTPRQEAALIRREAKKRARAGRSHAGGCLCAACRVRRIDENMRALRKITVGAKAVTA